MSQHDKSKEPMGMTLWCPELKENVRQRCVTAFSSAPLGIVLQIDQVERWGLDVLSQLMEVVQDVWRESVEQAAVHIARECPGCEQRRKTRWRKSEPMTVNGVHGGLRLGKPYLCCSNPECTAPGLSVTKMLTDISSGDSTLTTELMAARQASQESYGKASTTLRESLTKTEIERTKLRRMALAVEAEAVAFAERRRRQSLEALPQAGAGPDVLMAEADGGMVRTGVLHAIGEGEPHHGELTPTRKLPRRRREVSYREVVTMDVRKPGEVDPRAADAVVSAMAPAGEKARRLKALAAQAGMGSQTEMYGLGDMGSGLHTAFEQAFDDRTSFWQADRTHTRKYIRDAADVLLVATVVAVTSPLEKGVIDHDDEVSAAEPVRPADGMMLSAATASNESCSALDGEPLSCPARAAGTSATAFSPTQWKEQMWLAVYERDAERRDALIAEARVHRDPAQVPAPDPRRSGERGKCPIDKLDTYLTNNWAHFRFADMEALDRPTVSARAECQVRERTGGRFGGSAWWNLENIEGKAILRAIIFEGSYPSFVQSCWETRTDRFVAGLHARLTTAVDDKRLTREAARLLLAPNTTLADLRNYEPPSRRDSRRTNVARAA